MLLYNALPSELYEVLNCAITTTSFIAWIICIRYLLTQIHEEHKAAAKRRVKLSAVDTLNILLKLRLGVAMTVFLTGEWPRMGWVWLARYIANTHHEPGWMGTVPWVFVPIVSSVISVAGLACIIRAITPIPWGRYGYVAALLAAMMAVLTTQVIR